MKNNPETYEVPEEQELDEQTATVKQTLPPDEEGGRKKTVNKELQVGKEYSLAETLRRDGNSLTLAPKLKVLSKTLGGEYEVQLPTGIVTFLKPEDFKQFDIIDDENASEDVERIALEVASDAIAKAYPDVDLTNLNPLDVLASLNDVELVDAVEAEINKKTQEYKDQLAKIAEEAKIGRAHV